MTAPASTLTVDLVQRFPGIVSAETRPGFTGFIVEKDKLVEVATAIRDEFGYDFLTALTAVDYLPDNKMEVVYHAYKTTGGPGLVFRVQVPRVDPIEIPSLINVYPRSRPARTRSLGPFRNQIHRPSRPAPHSHVGRIRRSPPPQGLAGALLRRRVQTIQEPLARR
ncbi:MAG: NADH-quinone oxidoreductase subunit C [Anaerolineales bacterium]|nr:NADH-quinone oxidoreductase subunit C [Anaerolineales bacterium]